jgi:Cu(I)/Ag(I) efflux system membrane protein CusA/SilA
MTFILRGRKLRPESANPFSRVSVAIYRFCLGAALRFRWTTLLVNFAVVPAVVPLLFLIGTEFMPPLYEGSLLYMPTSPPGMSVTEATRMLQIQDRVLRRFPEVERVFGTVGRGTTATDNSPMGMVNTTVTLKPREQWRKGMTIEKLQAEMDDALHVPGFPNTWTQPIRNRLDMLFTGVKTPVGIKVLGPDLAVIQRIGLEIESALVSVPGTRSVYAERVTQGYFTDIDVDRAAIARHGVSVEDVQTVIETALGGAVVTRTLEGRERYPVNVRYARDFRDTLPAIGAVLVPTPDGDVPLSELARIEIHQGPAMIRDENGMLAGYVYVDTQARDLGGYVGAAQAAVRNRVTLPQGYRLDWTGQYEFQVRARERL